jgi:hypothetical protein
LPYFCPQNEKIIFYWSNIALLGFLMKMIIPDISIDYLSPSLK